MATWTPDDRLAKVIDLRTLAPLDLDTIETSVARTRRLVLVAEALTFGGFTSEVVSSIQESIFGRLLAPVIRVGSPHAPIPHRPVLIEAIVPRIGDVERAVDAVLGSDRDWSGGGAQPLALQAD